MEREAFLLKLMILGMVHDTKAVSFLGYDWYSLGTIHLGVSEHGIKYLGRIYALASHNTVLEFIVDRMDRIEACDKQKRV